MKLLIEIDDHIYDHAKGHTATIIACMLTNDINKLEEGNNGE